MALYSELPVYKATYDLLLAIFRFTKDFGKEYKYTVGESLKKETIELLDQVVSLRLPTQKKYFPALQNILPVKLFLS